MCVIWTSFSCTFCVHVCVVHTVQYLQVWLFVCALLTLSSCVHLWVCACSRCCAWSEASSVCVCVCVNAARRGQQQRRRLMAAEAEQQRPAISSCWLQPAREGKNESWKEREKSRTEGSGIQQIDSLGMCVWASERNQKCLQYRVKWKCKRRGTELKRKNHCTFQHVNKRANVCFLH